MKRQFGWIVCIVFLLTGVRAAAAQQDRGPSTPEERTRAVKVARELEQNPLAPEAKDDRTWVVQWIIDIPDITVDVCDDYFGKIPEPLTENARDVFAQMMISSAAFMIEHPGKVKDEQAVAMAGLLGSLKTYQAILKQVPDSRWRAVDKLVEMRDNGKLDDFVTDTLKQCKSKDDEEPPPGTVRTFR